MNQGTNSERLREQIAGEAAERQTNKRLGLATVLRIPIGKTFGPDSVGIQRTAPKQTPVRFQEAQQTAWLPELAEALRERGRVRLRAQVVFQQSRMADKERHQPEGQSHENQRHLRH
jgi:hypothetical protein